MNPLNFEFIFVSFEEFIGCLSIANIGLLLFLNSIATTLLPHLSGWLQFSGSVGLGSPGGRRAPIPTKTPDCWIQFSGRFSLSTRTPSHDSSTKQESCKQPSWPSAETIWAKITHIYLAVTYSRLGKFNQAEGLETMVLARKKILGDDHPDSLRAMSNLAATLIRRKHSNKWPWRSVRKYWFNRAEELETTVLTKQQEILGEDHPRTLRTMANLAATYSKLGQFNQAERLQRTVCDKHSKILGKDYSDTLNAVTNLATYSVKMRASKDPAFESCATTNPPVAEGQLMSTSSDVPPELWAVVAKSCRRQTLAELCVSQKFHAVFSSLRYGTTTDPPLSNAQAILLVEMLLATRTRNPAHLSNIYRHTCLAALECLFDAPGDDKPVRGAAPRALEWGMVRDGTDGLGALLCTSRCFPDLKEIVIECSPSYTRFEFLRIPHLEKIEVDLAVHVSRDSIAHRTRDIAPVVGRFECGTVSPAIIIATPAHTQIEARLDVYSDLHAAINGLHLSALALELSFAAPDFEPPMSIADFSAVLYQHPGLIDLTLHAEGMRILAPAEAALFLPRLGTFTGSLGHFAAIAAPQARPSVHAVPPRL
ncbi:hypothetical protein FB451DRAFT_1448719 [Mycena latifolia]|nr:hypothetical protein FB451DRAFT_1448719 [Mycena latifolia]